MRSLLSDQALQSQIKKRTGQCDIEKAADLTRDTN